MSADERPGFAVCTGCGERRAATHREWWDGFPDLHRVVMEIGECGCDGPQHDYFCPIVRWYGEWEWRPNA